MSSRGLPAKAQIDADQKRLERLTQELQDLITADGLPAKDIGKVNEAVTNFRRDLTRERWRQFLLASVLYVALGAFFAAVVAQDLLQAVAIGAGWTGIAGTLGLKQDYSQRKDTKDDAIDALTARFDELARKAEQPPAGEIQVDQIPPPPDLMHQVEVAKAL